MSILLNQVTAGNHHTDSPRSKVVETVLNTGVHAGDRTGTGTKSVSYVPSYYMLTGGSVPLISGKAVNLKPLLVELEWYLKGTGNIQCRYDNGVKIWDAWADENGDPCAGNAGHFFSPDDIVPVSHSEYLRKIDTFRERGYKVEGYLGVSEDRPEASSNTAQ
ncbi:thymidylate synthase [Escherichia coli]|uniref:thymidylate synthase n=1 Tax=Escherichia coli TaxID=562 RepID=UPI0039869D32